MPNANNLFSLPSNVWLIAGQIELTINYILLLSAFLLAIWKRRQIITWLSTNKLPSDKKQTIEQNISMQVEQCQGVIINLSRLDQMRWYLQQVNPQFIRIITGQNESFWDDAIQLQHEWVNQGKNVQISLLSDAGNINETYDAVQSCIHELAMNNLTHILVDVTGGTKAMSLGAYNAAKNNNITATYIKMGFIKNNSPVFSEAQITRI